MFALPIVLRWFSEVEVEGSHQSRILEVFILVKVLTKVFGNLPKWPL